MPPRENTADMATINDFTKLAVADRENKIDWITLPKCGAFIIHCIVDDMFASVREIAAASKDIIGSVMGGKGTAPTVNERPGSRIKMDMEDQF